MKAYVLKELGGVENLVQTDLPIPVIQDHEVLVAAKAISVNPVDAAVRHNEGLLNYMLRPEPGAPIIIGWDLSGVVTRVGAGVSDFKEGDEVFGLVNFPGSGKAYAEYVAVPANQLAHKPANISHQEAAAATLAGLTAWQALVTYGRIKQGDKVLVHSASGGVGHFAVQLAKHLGAHVTGTSSASNRDFVLSLGADAHIDYQNQQFEQLVDGADIVIDGVSHTGEHLLRSAEVVNPGGRIISLLSPFDDAANEKLQKKSAEGYAMLVNSNGDDLRKLAALLESKQVVSHVSHEFSFDELPEAHLQIETGKTVGKIAVKL